MNSRIVALCALALALAGSWNLPFDDQPIEVAAPLVVEVAPVLVAGPGHQVDPEIQAAMEAHAAEVREARRANEARDLPSGFAGVGSAMVATYPPTMEAPASVKAVVNEAVSLWSSVIETHPDGPIVVEVGWDGLNNPNLLGYAGPDGMFYGGGLPPDRLFPAALTNTLLGSDANGAGRPEIKIMLNSELADSNRWYLETTGSPPGGQIDLFSVVLHEIGHGLGFLGSASDRDAFNNPKPLELYSVPYVFDDLTSYGSTPMIEVADQPSALRSGDVHIDISDGLSQELYAPSNWAGGSSYSHFDESLYPSGSPGALMTPMLGSGETARILDSATLGVMAGMGWPITVPPTTPIITNAVAASTTATVSWDPVLWQSGVAPDQYRLEAWRDGSTLQATTTVSASATQASVGPLSLGGAYTIKLYPLVDGAAGNPASTQVQMVASAGPIDPSEWPDYVKDTPLHGQVNRLYQAYFLRLPDAEGFDYWLGLRAQGRSLRDLSAAFADSAEFQSRYGSLSDAAFVDLVYANVLGRVADTSGRDYWIGRLSVGLSRGDLMLGFAESNEYVGRTRTAATTATDEAKVVRLYRAFFGRDPDQTGLDYWVGQVRQGRSLDEVASAFANSAEFQNRYGSLSDAAFVDLVYANVLGRSPDPAGRDYWSGELARGRSRGAVMVGFSESTEFIRATGTIP